MSPPVRLDPALGFALIGHERIQLDDCGRDGRVQVGGPAGPVLKPPSFGERSRVVWRALASTDPRSAVARGMLNVALERDGEADSTILEILALSLAGADRAAAGFAETAFTVARATGTDLTRLDCLDATEVDRLSEHLEQHGTSAWQTLVLDATEPEPAQLRDQLADRLLRRAERAPAGDDESPTTGAASGRAISSVGPRTQEPLIEPPMAESPIHSWNGAASDPGEGLAGESGRLGDGSSSLDGLAVKDTTDPTDVVRSNETISHRTKPVSTAAGPGGRSAHGASTDIHDATRTPAMAADMNGSGGLRWRIMPHASVAAISPAPSGMGQAHAPERDQEIALTDWTPVTRGVDQAGFAAAAGRAMNTTGLPVVNSVAREPTVEHESRVRHCADDLETIAGELAERLLDEAALRGVFR